MSYTGRHAILVGYNPDQTRSGNVPIVSAYIKVMSHINIPVVLHVHEAPYMADSNVTLLSEYQVRENGLVIDSVSKRHKSVNDTFGTQRMIVSEHLHVPFVDRGGLLGCEILPWTEGDEDLYDIFEITKDIPWKPRRFRDDEECFAQLNAIRKTRGEHEAKAAQLEEIEFQECFDQINAIRKTRGAEHEAKAVKLEEIEFQKRSSKTLVAGDIPSPPRINAIRKTRGEHEAKAAQLEEIESRKIDTPITTGDDEPETSPMTVHLEKPSVLDLGEKLDIASTKATNENRHITVQVHVIGTLTFVTEEPTVPYIFDPKLIRTSFDNLCKASYLCSTNHVYVFIFVIKGELRSTIVRALSSTSL